MPTADTLCETRSVSHDFTLPGGKTLRVLDSICHNELLRAMGYDQSQYVEIAWYQRLFAQFIDIREHAISPH